CVFAGAHSHFVYRTPVDHLNLMPQPYHYAPRVVNVARGQAAPQKSIMKPSLNKRPPRTCAGVSHLLFVALNVKFSPRTALSLKRLNTSKLHRSLLVPASRKERDTRRA